MEMQRILIIGCGGAGKSTLALKLGKLLDLPVIHLDREFWRPGWIETPQDTWVHRVTEISGRARWIMDGNYDRSLHIRLPAADTLIFLDFSPMRCLFRVFKRRVRFRRKSRPDMGEGCPEQLNFAFLKWIWRFPHETRPEIDRCIQQFGAGKNIYVIKNSKSLSDFLNGLIGSKDSLP